MAALNRRNPNLDDFVGLNWSCWVDRVNILPSDAGSTEDSSMCGGNRSETMTLRKEDMHIYGHCPAHDEFYLVVCSHCGQVVKPEAFEKHCVRRHGPLTKMCGQSSTLAPQQRPRPCRPLSNLSSSRERQKDGRHHEDANPPSAALPAHQHRPSKAQREAVSLPSVEKFPQENHPHPHHSSSTPRLRVPPRHAGPLPPGPCSSSTPPSERPSVQKSTAGQSSESHSPSRGTRTYSRIHKNIDKKECDLNKHCRVLDPERKKPGSQELICNTDCIQQQQKALGRAKSFDQLAVEQRAASAGRDMEQLLVKLKDKEQHLEVFEEKITTQGNRYNFNSNCHILRSRDSQESFPEEEGDSTVEVEVQPPYPFNQSLLSSEESEDDEQEETTDLPASPWHPKPLGLCTFGCRTLGCSIFTFDRRLHHLQFALSAMLEHHVSTHLWKKMPQVSSGLRSCHVKPPPTVRTAARPSQSTGSLSLESTSLGQLETKSSQHNSQSTKPPSSTSSASFGPGRRGNAVGRPSKAQLKEVALMQDASTAQKATRLPHSREDKSSRHIRDPPLQEKAQPHIPSFQGPATVTFSRGKKPCPPLPLQPSERHLSGLEKRSPLPATTHCSPRSRGKPPGIQQKVVGYDHKGRGQKRKGSSEQPPLSSSVSRTSKCKRLSSPSRSSLLTWKGENIGSCLEKRSNS
ncbi:ataxin-7-like protein 2 [Seriola lalandi dorsalis]|uniref:Ataxin 7-like 2b n=1 Tax=Seriola lalandi dorsalis TaxID=1841481 RepID=A0A3B4WK44_SERLL|nr:ataxin-7-like protein 2 [Seriola lalandi dorsalis]XP_056241154.1 ataxin-7-like protein 2b [Seriola aureovittata]